jgi:sulfite oxidase
MDEYVTSIPLDWVVSKEGDNSVLLATSMNGEPLPRDHGYPLRALIPGYAGARSVKWLSSVRIIDGESNSAWNRIHYKHPKAAVGTILPAAIGSEGAELASAAETGMISCCELPMNSMVLIPDGSGNHNVDADGKLAVEGIAYSGGLGTSIASVEVSTDRGATWQPALIESLQPADVTEGGQNFGWRRWACSVTPPEAGGELWCRATDSLGRCQPQLGLPRRNQPVGGYFYNGWHRVKL